MRGPNAEDLEALQNAAPLAPTDRNADSQWRIALLFPAAAQAWYVDVSITGAGRVYETTDANELDEHCPDSIEGFASTGTTPTGTLGASCRAGDATGDYGYGWVVRYVAEPAPGHRFAGWQSDGRTNPGPVLCDGAGGSPNYAGAACQFATFANLQTRARFVDDTNPTMNAVTGPNGTVSGPASFTFSAATDPTFRLFECRVGGAHEWQTCSSGRQEDPPSGTYTFQVRGVDWSGNRSGESTWQWTVDKTPRPRRWRRRARAAPSRAPRRRSASRRTRTWTVDTVAAETVLDPSGPSGNTIDTTATFAFSSEPGAAFNCRLDNQAINTNCTSPVTYTGLAEGQHTFRVWARDAVGNTDASPELRLWTVVAAPPPPEAGVVASPASQDFGSQAVATIGASRTVTLTSTGDAPLAIDRVRITGSHPEDFLAAADACTGETVAPDATCTVKLRFAPSATGARSAVLRVRSGRT